MFVIEVTSHTIKAIKTKHYVRGMRGVWLVGKIFLFASLLTITCGKLKNVHIHLRVKKWSYHLKNDSNAYSGWRHGKETSERNYMDQLVSDNGKEND